MKKVHWAVCVVLPGMRHMHPETHAVLPKVRQTFAGAQSIPGHHSELAVITCKFIKGFIMETVLRLCKH